MIHRYEIPCMDLQQIHQSGQCFRMVPLPEHTYPSEDDDEVRCFLERELSLHFKIRTAANGKDALRYSAGVWPRLILAKVL